jgi:fumarate reductase flavoprotein subunit
MGKIPEGDSNVSRRSFLGRAAAGITAGALVEIAGNASPAVQVHAQAPSVREMRTDVVSVGAGMGGLTAALQAQKSGARVIVLEKAGEPGGTTAHSNGHVLRHTYEDMRATAPDGDPEVQRTVVENIHRWDELMDAIDAPVGALRPVPGTNDQTFRMVASVMWTSFMVGTIESGGGKVLVETPMVRLLTNHQNEIIGLLAESPQGLIRIYAKAVVLATGGWMTNAMLIQQYITRYFGGLYQRNASAKPGHPPFLGDGLLAALQLGAQPSTGGFDSFYGHMMPARPAVVSEPMENFSSTFSPWGVAVNRFGRRFTDEAQGRLTGRQMNGQSETLCAQEVARQPDAMGAYICDNTIYKRHACDNCDEGGIGDYPRFKMAGAPVARANTLPELAKQMESWGVGMSAETVLHELTEYNQAAKNGKTWALPVPKTSAKHAIVLEHPPFYAILGQPGIIATHGGIRVNALGQVLHRSGKPILGLFAAGVDIGNFNNCAYLGNLNLGAAYGCVSGENAAKQPVPKGGWEIAAISG